MSETWYQHYWTRAARAHDYRDLSLLAERADAVGSVWPAQARVAADVGAGRGELVEMLRARGVRAFGLDLSAGGRPAVQASIAALPLKAGAVDLAMASEVLEHVPNPQLPAAVAELMRVARRFCLVTVPLDEQLDYEQVTCQQCRGRFNSVGHLRSVAREDVLAWFAPWRLVAERAIGWRKRIHPLAARTVVALQGSRNVSWSGGEVLCPMCGATTPFSTPSDGLWNEVILRARGLLWRLGRRTPQIGLFLFERP